MKAMQVVESDGGLTVIAADAQKPKPSDGEVLVEVHAAGVTTTELSVVSHDPPEERRGESACDSGA